MSYVKSDTCRPETKEFIFDGLRKFPQLTIPLLPFCAHTHRTELVCPRNTLSFSCFSTSHSTTVWSPEAVSIFSSLSIHVMSNIALLCACQSVHQVYKRFGHSISYRYVSVYSVIFYFLHYKSVEKI